MLPERSQQATHRGASTQSTQVEPRLLGTAQEPDRIMGFYQAAVQDASKPEEGVRAMVREMVRRGLRASDGAWGPSLLGVLGTAGPRGSLARVLSVMQEDGLMEALLPEVDRCVGVGQGARHGYDVFEHLIRAADAGPADRPLLRLALLLHDIGKPECREYRSGYILFRGHAERGASLVGPLLARLGIEARSRAWVTEAVRYHMWLAPDRVPVDGMVRLRSKLRYGVTLDDLIDMRIADKAGTGVASRELGSERIEALRDAAREAMTKPLPVWAGLSAR